MEKLPTVLFPEVDRAPLPPVGTHHKPPRGRSESQFERDLWRYFPGKIHTGLLVKRPELQQPYVPDFAYLDRALAIDIEVDEPYTYDTRQPIHFLDCPKDRSRNQFFTDHGWIVIRFSEAQVIKSPASCCKAIASTIALISHDNSIMSAFRQVPTLKPDRRWTAEQAQQLATQNYRERLQHQPIEESLKQRRTQQSNLMNGDLSFHCPTCGELVRWQGHYIKCANCGYDKFVL
ncbi:DUF559 domain-containing protein [Cyanobacteria bacterium FACHB-DQ100]|nr:DUF559 domain-containing protein [Cyanobacteria bacterium FACHB-DQ100]